MSYFLDKSWWSHTRYVFAFRPLRARGLVGSGSDYGKAPMNQVHIVIPMLSLEVATPENKSIHSTLSSICKKVRLTSGS